ncbi:MAG: DUF3352 domain-containing protein [Bacillota bacterium]
MRVFLAGLLTAVIFPLVTFAQPLGDRVPADAILYIGWQGSQSMPPAYQTSHLKGFLDSSNLPEFFQDVIPQALAPVIKRNPQAAPAIQALQAVGSIFWRHPTAFFFAGADFKTGDPRPKIGLLCQAGNDADALLLQLQAVTTLAGRDADLPIKTVKQGDLVALIVGYEQENLALAGKESPNQPKPLASNPKFQRALQQAGKDSVALFYLDGEAMLSLVDGELRDTSDADSYAMWAKVRDALGLAGLREILFAAGFDGKQWCTQGFIAMSSPRNGIAALLDTQPLSTEIVKLIPQTTTWAGAGQLNLVALFDGVRGFVAGLNPEAAAQIDRGLAQINQALQINLRQDLLAALGTEWAFYIDPVSTGTGMTGVTFVNRLAKPAEAERSLVALENMGNMLLAGALAREQMQISFTQQKVGNLTLHTLGVPLFAPSWTIKDGVLYIGLYPQTVVAAAESRKDKSILDNVNFQSLQKQMGSIKPASFSFIDLPQVAAESYQTLLPLAQLGLGVANMSGIKTPALVFPPFNRLLEHLTPAATFAWTDEAGYHVKSITPFPGSEALTSNSNMTVGSSAMMAGILLPALEAARERANRVKCASNLRQIGQCVMLYSVDNQGKFPPDLGTLMTAADLPPMVFTCPTGNHPRPAQLRFNKPEDAAKWVNENSDYIYLAGQMNNRVPANTILAYEKPENHDREGVNMLFGDGHVEWVPLGRAMNMIQKQQAPKNPQP